MLHALAARLPTKKKNITVVVVANKINRGWVHHTTTASRNVASANAHAYLTLCGALVIYDAVL